MAKRKQGEKEALLILQSIGVQVDEEYCDDNSNPRMPDLKYLNNERKIEVTHTVHNNEAYKVINKYDQYLDGEDDSAWIKRHIEKEKACKEAMERLQNLNYEKDDEGKYTVDAQERYLRDCKLIKEHLGHDITKVDPQEQHSEFNCDRPSIWYSTDNILYAINNKKKKHDSGNTDLFLFVAIEEYNLMQNLLSQFDWNKAADHFLNYILTSPFQTVYICEWDIDKQQYNTINPRMTRFESVLNWKHYNE